MRIRRRPAAVLSPSSLPNPDPPKATEIPADKYQKTTTADRGEEYEERRAQRLHLVVDLNREAIISSFTCNHQALNNEETPNLEESHSHQLWINGSKSTATNDYGNKSNGGKEEGRKRRSPAVLMEGSRCSRVNGRGWRCCQQTLVGYSLCEHHLGKGRLRSISTVKGQLGSKMPPSDADSAEKGSATPERCTGVEEEKSGRKKNGMKARSINSLLDESSSSAASPPEMTMPPPPRHGNEDITAGVRA